MYAYKEFDSGLLGLSWYLHTVTITVTRKMHTGGTVLSVFSSGLLWGGAYDVLHVAQLQSLKGLF